MAYRSQSLLRLSRLAILCAALVPALLSGCQSNAQQDLIAREMRMQEDQLYAMEDYLAQYQQLICKYRSENAALKRELAECEAPDTALPATRPSPSPRNGPPPRLNGPAIEVPPTPKTNGAQPPLDVPDVPPLEETTSIRPDGEAALAAGQDGMESPPIAQALALEPTTKSQPIRNVELLGDVIANEDGGGPRLVVAVQPRDDAGNAAKFTGALSLMLLAPGDDGSEKLARWDFGPEDVKAAVDATIGAPIMRFHLELPADTPVRDSSELWVRLLPRGGDKLLAHAPINLHEPGPFTSLPQAPVPQEQLVEQELSAQVAMPDITAVTPSKLSKSGWTTARPGAPANVPGDADDSQGEWRASSEPTPAVVVSKVPVRPKRRLRPPAPHAEAPKTVAAEARTPAGWSPDRPPSKSTNVPRMATAPTRPTWSATR